MKENRLTIIMTSCKWYDDILEIHEKLQALHWPDCPYRRILVMDDCTEGAAYLDAYDEVLITGPESGKKNHVRIQEALKKVDTEFVMFLQEDMLLFDKVDTDRLERLIDVAENDKNIGFIRLLPYAGPEAETAVSYDEEKNLVQYTDKTPYRVTYAPSIWRTDFLTKMSAPFIYGADFERKGTELCKQMSELTLGYKYSAYPSMNAIRRGKWEAYAITQVQYYDIDIDFKKHGPMTTKDNLKQGILGYIYGLNPNGVLKLQNKIKLGKRY